MFSSEGCLVFRPFQFESFVLLEEGQDYFIGEGSLFCYLFDFPNKLNGWLDSGKQVLSGRGGLVGESEEEVLALFVVAAYKGEDHVLLVGEETAVALDEEGSEYDLGVEEEGLVGKGGVVGLTDLLKDKSGGFFGVLHKLYTKALY